MAMPARVRSSGDYFAYGAERGWTLSCGMPGAGHLVPAGRIRTAALNLRSLIGRGGARQDGAWGTGLTTPACTKPACSPRTFDRLAPAGRATTLLTRRAWPTAAQTAIVGAFTARHHTLFSALRPARAACG
jgi:hypothetical protein